MITLLFQKDSFLGGPISPLLDTTFPTYFPSPPIPIFFFRESFVPPDMSGSPLFARYVLALQIVPLRTVPSSLGFLFSPSPIPPAPSFFGVPFPPISPPPSSSGYRPAGRLMIQGVRSFLYSRSLFFSWSRQADPVRLFFFSSSHFFSRSWLRAWA